MYSEMMKWKVKDCGIWPESLKTHGIALSILSSMLINRSNRHFCDIDESKKGFLFTHVLWYPFCIVIASTTAMPGRDWQLIFPYPRSMKYIRGTFTCRLTTLGFKYILSVYIDVVLVIDTITFILFFVWRRMWCISFLKTWLAYILESKYRISIITTDIHISWKCSMETIL